MTAKEYLLRIGFDDAHLPELFNDDDKSYYKITELMEAYLKQVEKIACDPVLAIVTNCYDRADMQDAFNAGGVGESWENWIKEYDSPV